MSDEFDVYTRKIAEKTVVVGKLFSGLTVRAFGNHNTIIRLEVQGPVGKPEIYPVVRYDKVIDYGLSEREAFETAHEVVLGVAGKYAAKNSMTLEDRTPFKK